MAKAQSQGKLGTLVKLMRGKRGAGIDRLCAATGWQAHSVRAAISGLRKSGHEIDRTAGRAEGEGSSYKITSEPAVAGDR